MVKDLVLGEIENNLRSKKDSWVDQWMNNEVSILDEFIKDNEPLISSCKCSSGETIESITFRDLQDCCIRAKPFLQDKWVTDQAMAKMNVELTNIKNYMSEL
jgi:hypothetical protein